MATVTHHTQTAQPNDPTKDVSATAWDEAHDVTLVDGDIPASIARDTEVTSAIAALSSTYQPLDSDLTAIAALTTTSYGRAFLALADAAAGRTALGLGTASTHATGDYDASGAAAAAQSASQPLDSDLTAIAALTTTSFGRGLLALADAAALRTSGGLVIGTDVEAHDADLTAIAALTSAADKVPYATGAQAWALADLTAAGRALIDDASASAQRTTLGLGTLATQSGTFSGTSSGTNTGDQVLPTRASLGLDTTDSPQFAGLNVGAATDTTVTRTGAGDIAVEGNALYRAGGTDVPVADGGTGASTASAARTNLGLVPGTDVASLTAGVVPIAQLATGTPTGAKFIRDDGVLAAPAGGGTITTGGAVLSGGVVNIASTAAFTDVLSASLAAGTWIGFATLMCLQTAGGTSGWDAKIWEAGGPTVYGSGDTTVAAGVGLRAMLSIVTQPFVLGGTTTVKISVRAQGNANLSVSDVTTVGTAKASNLVFIKVA